MRSERVDRSLGGLTPTYISGTLQREGGLDTEALGLSTVSIKMIQFQAVWLGSDYRFQKGFNKQK